MPESPSFRRALSPRACVALCAILLTASLAAPRAEAQVERWTVYSALNVVQDVAFDSSGNVWAATTGGVVMYRSDADSFAVFRTTEGLFSLNSSAIAVGPAGRVFVGATDGGLSIRGLDGSWTALSEIAQFDRPDRRINGFAFVDGSALVLTSFGVAVLKLDDLTFRDTWSQLGRIPRNSVVYDATILRDTIWLATAEGVAAAPVSGRALSDPGAWTVFKQDEGLATVRVRGLAVAGEHVVAATDSGAFILRGSRFEPITELENQPVRVANHRSIAVATGYFSVYRYDGGSFQRSGLQAQTVIGNVTVSPSGRVALGVATDGLALQFGDTLAVLRPNAPLSNVFTDLTVAPDGSLWASSGVWGSSPGLTRLSRERWTNYRSGQDGMPASGSMTIGLGGDSAVWVGTWGGGVLRVADTVAAPEQYNATNSPVWGNQIVGDVAGDFAGRTWIVLYEPESNNGPALMVRLAPGEQGSDNSRFVTFDPPDNPISLFRSIAVDQFGTKWLGSQSHSGRGVGLGLRYFSENGTLESKTDDTWGTLTTADKLLSNIQTALAVDRDGALWIGTPDGLNVLDNPGTVAQSGPQQASIRTIRPLRSVPVSAIVVDALNRKWIGTNQGIFVLSADGVDVVARYRKSTSPLVDDNVISLATDPVTGDMYIGTLNGLNRLTTVAVEAPPTPGVVTIWPQPLVLPAAEPARIAGLPALSTIKIVSLDGRVVHQFDSPGGGIAYWDGTANGEPVASGVYLVAAGSPTGQETVVGKIAVVRQ